MKRINRRRSVALFSVATVIALASELGGRAVFGVVAAAITVLMVLPAGLSRPGRQGLVTPVRAEGRTPAAIRAKAEAAKRHRHRR